MVDKLPGSISRGCGIIGMVTQVYGGIHLAKLY